MEIKITDIEIYLFKNSIQKELKFPVASYVLTGFIFFKVKTNIGIYGFGEPSPYGGNTKNTLKIFKKYLFPYVINKKIELININFFKKFDFFKKNEIILRTIIAGLDQAIWDIKAKIKGKPLFKILSKRKKNKNLKLYASGGMIFDYQNYDYLINEALKFKNLGFYGYKFRPSISKKKQSHFLRNKYPPDFDTNKFLKFFYKIRKSVGDNFNLMVDFGCRIKSIKQFRYISDCMSELNFFFMEEPMKRNIELYKRLMKNSKIDIATGETISSIKRLSKWKSSCNIIQPDSNLITISELMDIKKNSKKYNQNIILHNWANPISMLSNFHVSKALGCELIEYNITYNPFSRIIPDNTIKINKGLFTHSSLSGLGIELNNNIINKYRIKI
jgi:L-alanine-DL-glutamate epimerase-like enolase superfamily enzyme